MPEINVQEATIKFRKRLEEGYYPKMRSRNTEGNYSEEKEPRDTEAVQNFVGTPYFEHIRKMK
jgi:hypothetical protein